MSVSLMHGKEREIQISKYNINPLRKERILKRKTQIPIIQPGIVYFFAKILFSLHQSERLRAF